MIKHIVRFLTASGALAFFATSLHATQNDPAANYPNKPIRFIVPFSPGAGTDITARTIAQKLSEKWGHQVVADNGLIPVGSSPEEFADFIKKDIVKQAAVVKLIGLEPQ